MAQFFCSLMAFLLICLPGISEEVIVRAPSGDYFSIEIDPTQPFHEVAEQIGHTFSSEGYVFDCGAHYCGPNSSREYWREVTSKEKEDIRYILTTLATNGWVDLMNKQSALEKVGDRIDHLHPLRFLMTVFTDEELKGCVHAIRDRNRIWKEFFGPMTKTMDGESDRNNMKKEFVQDFAKKVRVDAHLLIPQVQSRQWNELMDTLLKQLPRQGNPERYGQ